MKLLRRKIYDYLLEWKASPERLPLIVKGARQIGKTEIIKAFADEQYISVVSINFALQPRFKTIFADGYEVDTIVRNISILAPKYKFVVGKTLIFFDELQECPAAATALKSFAIDKRYDVICSGSLMGINYNEIESNAVGYKVDYEMHSMDFEEFLWAKGYDSAFVDMLYDHMLNARPLSDLLLTQMYDLFREYLILGGMPAVVNRFITTKNFSGTLQMQRQLLLDYEEDITKYAEGLDKGKIKNIYNHISVFLAQENKKFQISKVSRNARSRDYVGTIDWLADAGIINVCYCLDQVALPLKGNYNPKLFKLYFRDTGLLIASLDEEAQDDLRANNNWGTYKGAIYENIVGDMLVKQGYKLYFYKNEKSTIEMDFFVRDAHSLVPLEVKATDGATRSLNRLLTHHEQYSDIRYGIKLCHKNIGFNGQFYTFPYFLTFLLRRFLREKGLSSSYTSVE